MAGKNVMVAAAKPLPTERPIQWAGNETLPGYGKLSFAMYSNGRVVMVDAKSTSEGSWRREENQYTLTFSGGAVLRLEVECLEVELADLGPAWVTEACPAHAVDAPQQG